jgi:ribonuclease P protein component
MLQHRFRFHGHGSLRYLYQHGKVFRSTGLQLRCSVNERRVHNRCTIIVSRKVLKAAPKRNRVRRRLYEFLRVHWQYIPAAHDIAITVYDASLNDMPAAELHQQLVELLQKAGLWQKPSKTEKTPAD